jgi:hypothetical protein
MVKGYLKPTTFIKLEQYAQKNEVSKSSIIEDAVKEYVEKRSPQVVSPFQSNNPRRNRYPE